jgi:hypothetical protein
MKSSIDEEETHFMNVDLEVLSHESLAPLVQALGNRVFVLHEGRWGRRYGAFLELSGSGYQRNADLLIRRLIALLKKLPASARRLWRGARVKQFNLGIEAAHRPRSFELRLQDSTLESVARLGASVVVTVYAAELPQSAITSTVPRGKGPPNDGYLDSSGQVNR